MADPWQELARAERKLEQKAAKGLLKLEKTRLRVARERERLEKRLLRRDKEAQGRARRVSSAEERESRRRSRNRGRQERERTRRGARDRSRRARGREGSEELHGSRGQRRRRQTPEERAYREARRRVNAKIGFMTHGISYLSVLTMILVTTRSFRTTFVVAAAWGICVALHYFAAVVAPGLRTRMIEDEVGRGVAQVVTQKRRATETRHERSLEDLSASIAHEIRNPVTAAKSLVQQMGEDPVSRENVDYARVALEELDRVERSISHLLRYARDEEIRFEPFDMSDVIDSAIQSFRDRIDLLSVELEVRLDTPGSMLGDAEKMRRVLVNLVGNALDALEQSDTPVPRLQIEAGENLAGTEVWVTVRDNGQGIRPEVLDKVFSPFFTTKAKGTGLGLALSKKVVDAHGGTLEVTSTTETGTEFLLTFPNDSGGTV